MLTIYETQKISRTNNTERIKIKSEQDVYKLKQIEEIKDKVQEHLIVIALNSKNYIDSIELVGIGSSSCIMIEPIDVLRCAIVRGSKGIIVAHNHPSGDNIPSKSDIEFTNRLNGMAKSFNLELLDHIVIADENLSMKGKGYIYENYNKSVIENDSIKELRKQNGELMSKVEKLENRLNRSNRKLDSESIEQDNELEM